MNFLEETLSSTIEKVDQFVILWLTLYPILNIVLTKNDLWVDNL